MNDRKGIIVFELTRINNVADGTVPSFWKLIILGKCFDHYPLTSIKWLHGVSYKRTT